MWKRLQFLVVPVLLAAAAPALAQDGLSEWPAAEPGGEPGQGLDGEPGDGGVDVSLEGVVIVDDWGSRWGAMANLEWGLATSRRGGRSEVEIHPCARRPPAVWCWLRIYVPIIVFPDWGPGPWDGPIPGFASPASDLRMGPAVYALPSVGVALGQSARIRPTISVGGGVVWEGGRETNISGAGTFSTESMVAPVATAALTVDVPVSRRVALTMSGRGLAVFAGDREITTPTGRVTMEGRRTLSPAFTAGLSFSP